MVTLEGLAAGEAAGALRRGALALEIGPFVFVVKYQLPKPSPLVLVWPRTCQNEESPVSKEPFLRSSNAGAGEGRKSAVATGTITM